MKLKDSLKKSLVRSERSIGFLIMWAYATYCTAKVCIIALRVIDRSRAVKRKRAALSRNWCKMVKNSSSFAFSGLIDRSRVEQREASNLPNIARVNTCVNQLSRKYMGKKRIGKKGDS